MDWAGPLAEGLRLALAPAPLAAIGVGALLGCAVGVWAGAGALAAIALLMPVLGLLDTLPALALIAGLYLGAQVGGAWGVVLTGAPGEPSALAASADASALARRGRARSALAVALGSSFGAGLAALGGLVVLVPVVLTLAFHFGPAEYAALSLLALAGAVAWSPGSTVKALAMALLGLLAGRWLAPGGAATLPGLAPQVPAAAGFVALVVGVFALTEAVAAMASPRRPSGPSRDAALDEVPDKTLVTTADAALPSSASPGAPGGGVRGHTAAPAAPEGATANPAGPAADQAPSGGPDMALTPACARSSIGSDLRAAAPAALRGALLGGLSGVLPGGGAVPAAFASLAVERRIAGVPGATRPGHGSVRGLAGPVGASSAGAQSAFLPALTLGLPPNAVMALLIGTLALHGVVAGPSLATGHAGLLWGLLAAMAIGHGLLLLFGLALLLALSCAPVQRRWPMRAGGDLRVGAPQADAATVPAEPVAPSAANSANAGVERRTGWRSWVAAVVWSAWVGLAVLGLGRLGAGPGLAWLAAAIALAAVLAQRLGCPPAPLVLGVVLWPPLEGQLLRLLTQDGGPVATLAGRPLALGLVAAAALWVAAVALSRWRRRRMRVSTPAR
jgi:putative tricarboxylic transport membrane protein